MNEKNFNMDRRIEAALQSFFAPRRKANYSLQNTIQSTFTKHAQHQTRTPETETKYRNRAELLKRQFERETGIACNTSTGSKHLVDWLISRKESFLYSTWRFYKASMVFAIEEGTLPVNAAAATILKATNSAGCSKTRGNTSSKKPKKIPEADFRQLVDYLHARKNRWAPRTSVWLQAGVMAGLRPCEWVGAVLQDGEGSTCSNDPDYKRPPFGQGTKDERLPYTLTVPNAKATNGRGNGASRTIPLHLTERETLIIALHIFSLNYYAKYGKYETYYDNCRNTLYRACKHLFKNRHQQYTFYSARHQFAANRKASGESKGDTAQVMGHASLETAQHHYGRRSAGWKNVPHQAQVIDIDVNNDRSSPNHSDNNGPKM